MEQKKPWGTEIQEWFFYAALFCLFVQLVVLQWEVSKDVFGPYLFLAKLINAVFMWICGFASAKKIFALGERLGNVIKNVKSGKEDDN